MTKTFNASEFEDKFIRLVEDVVDTHEKAVITKEGVPIAEITPISSVPKKRGSKSIVGAMKGEIVMKDDLVAPAWDGDFGEPN